MKHKKDEEVKQDMHEDQALSNLLRLVGNRPVVPDEVRERVRRSLHAQWRRGTRIRIWRKRFLFAMSAAAVVMVLYTASLWLVTRSLPSAVPLGFVENRAGTVLATLGHSGDQKSQVLSRGDFLLSNSWLETGENGRAMLHLLNGPTVRMDVNTRFYFSSESSFVLDRGTVYVDSEGTGAKLVLLTSHGTIKNLGTQFEVNVNPEALRLRVREGAVILQRNGSEEQAAAGTQLSITRQGTSSRTELASYSPSYDWLSEIGPTYHLEGTSLNEFLGWISRESGLKVEYADPAIQQSSSRIVLHGSVRGLRPEEMPSVVLPVCGLTYELEEGILRLDRSR